MIPNGSIVTYRGHWPYSVALWSAANYVGEVGSGILTSGLAVRTSHFSGSLIFQGVPFEGLDVELEIEVQNGVGFATPQDIISIIRHWVYVVGGEFPSSDTMPIVQTPGGRPSSTGQPSGGTSSGVKPSVCTAKDVFNGLCNVTDWLDSLTTSGLFSIGLVAIGLLAAFFLIGARPVEVITRASK
jgi:hypothetical protein